MSRKPKYSAEQKVNACEAFLSGKMSVQEIADKLSMKKRGKNQVRKWIEMYEANGPSIFQTAHHNASYSKEFKRMAVIEYLTGSSQMQICAKYGIRSDRQLRSWILKYTSHKELGDYNPHPEVHMANKKKTTIEERKGIVQYCIDHDFDYTGTALKYGCSYSQVYQWVRKYKKNGIDALVDKRGHKKKEAELTELEKAQRRIKQLEHENLLKDREIELLKKLEELERRW